jgi:peptidoglycan/LPS O-acetylase OafA/YrhL
VSLGYVGVSLFLVLSGTCLSLPLLTRRVAGHSDWFVPSTFFARRCLRILPPYYVALVCSIAVSFVVAWVGWTPLPHVGPPPTLASVLAHVALIHNLTPYTTALNAPYWSLGLEWQWYWAFPVLLFLCVWSPWRAAVLCALCATAWSALFPHAFAVNGLVSGALPMRLVEFCGGIVAARLIVERRVPPAPFLVVGLVVPWVLILYPATAPHSYLVRHLLGLAGWTQPLAGISFTSLVLLASRGGPVARLACWRPLVGLGLMSYSVYLVHDPIVEMLALHSLLAGRPVVLLMGVAALGGVLGGTVFYQLVERHCVSRARVARVVPRLSGAFGWTDRLYRGHGILHPTYVTPHVTGN